MTAVVNVAPNAPTKLTSTSITLASGDSYTLRQVPANTGIQVNPGSGATVTVKVKTGPDATAAPIDSTTASYTSAALIATTAGAYEIILATTGGSATISLTYNNQ